VIRIEVFVSTTTLVREIGGVPKSSGSTWNKIVI
jgi:hypothetical protein